MENEYNEELKKPKKDITVVTVQDSDGLDFVFEDKKTRETILKIFVERKDLTSPLKIAKAILKAVKNKKAYSRFKKV